MKTIVDLLLLAAALCSVFFVAGLAGVPKIVRFFVFLIGPSFLLTFLLHLRFPNHVDYGLTAVSLALIGAAVTGFKFTHTAEMSRDERLHLVKRFALLFALSAVTVAIVAALIVKMAEPQRPAATPSVQTVPDTAKAVELDDSTLRAIDHFKHLAQ